MSRKHVQTVPESSSAKPIMQETYTERTIRIPQNGILQASRYTALTINNILKDLKVAYCRVERLLQIIASLK